MEVQRRKALIWKYKKYLMKSRLCCGIFSFILPGMTLLSYIVNFGSPLVNNIVRCLEFV